MGANLKRQIIEGVKQTWQQLNDFARSHYGRDNTEGQDTAADLDDQSQPDIAIDQSTSETSEGKMSCIFSFMSFRIDLTYFSSVLYRGSTCR